MTNRKKIFLLLDNIRSVHNVGSIFRTAETLAILKIYCIGTTPCPLDRFNRKRSDFEKVSLGAENMIQWEYLEDSASLITKLKKEDFQIVAIEQSSKSIDYKKVELKNKALIILGSETDGISSKILASADIIAEIPLLGNKESLNVSVAAGIALYRILDH